MEEGEGRGQGLNPEMETEPEDQIPEEQISEEQLNEQERLCFVDRELSWLQFNLRVLMEAGDSSVPILERLKFLGIYRSNLEEFFMVRVGSLTHRSILLPDEQDEKTGWTAAEQIKAILAEINRQQKIEKDIYAAVIKELKNRAVDVLDCRKLSKQEETAVQKLFADMRPLLSPQIVDNNHPFPFIGNKETYVAVALDHRDDFRVGLVGLFRLPAYKVLELDGRQKVVFTANLVQHYASALFKKENVREAVALRVTCNADVLLDYYESLYDEDAKAGMKKMLKKRGRQQPVRLEICGKPSGKMVSALAKQLNVSEANVFHSSLPFDFSFGSGVRKEPGMKYPERKPQRTVALQKGEFFSYLREKDLILSFPFQSIVPFVDFLYEAADDPDVVSIRITLYRLSSSSKIAAALAYAADRGKDVLCLLELRARFDEQNNIDYSDVLEGAGCRIIYGLPDKKVHSKLCLITRKSGECVEYFTQVGTGNYNEITSELYTDLSLMTSNYEVGQDAAATFEALALGQIPPETKSLWVAPRSFRSRVLEFIEAETQKGGEGRIAIKVNSVNDLGVMRALIRASCTGVRIELFVRGICCLRPGISGMTENITVHSTVGRYLEHSRIFCFGEGEEQRIFLGSGDLLNRNTRRRVECFIECTQPDTRHDVLQVLEAMRRDGEKSWEMQPDGSYVREAALPGTASQDVLYDYFGSRIVEAVPDKKKKSGRRHGFLCRLFHWGK